MNELIDLKVLQDYRIWLRFKDGEEKIIKSGLLLEKALQRNCWIGRNSKRHLLNPAGASPGRTAMIFVPTI